MTDDTAGTNEDAPDPHVPPTKGTDSAADAGSESPEEGAAAIATAEDAVIDPDAD